MTGRELREKITVNAEKYKNIVEIAIALLFIFGFFIWGLAEEDQVISEAERRPMATLPKLSGESILTGQFTSEFQKYTLDQFPMRDKFRAIKAFSAIKIYNKKENNGMYMVDNQIVKMEYPIDEKSLTNAAEKFNNVYERYLKTNNTRVFFAVVPDKAVYASKIENYPHLSYEKLQEAMKEKMPYASFIDLENLLNLEAYYTTDTHWRQECLTDVAAEILYKMGAKETGDAVGQGERNYRTVQAKDAFYGVYYGQWAMKHSPDKLYYLENDDIDNYVVFDYETESVIGVYDEEKLVSQDPYEFFLGGSKSLVTISNEAATSDKELIIFRDSFGSSLAPLLAEGYRKVTVIDIRYINPILLEKFVDFEGKDVLFLYSTLVLNNSYTLK